MGEERPEYRDRLQRVMDFMERHLDRQLTLNELAEQACFSPFHFHRMFSACMGEGQLECFRRIRIERSAILLAQHRERTITDIAFSLGFSSPEALTRAFKRQMGVSPIMYRRDPMAALRRLRRRETAELPAPTIPRSLDLSVLEQPSIRAVATWSWNGYGPHLLETWKELHAQAGALGLLGDGCRLLGLSLDDPLLTPAPRCRYVACIVPPPGRSLPRDLPMGLVRKRLDAGTFIRLETDGRIELLQNAYRWFYLVWLTAPGRDFEPVSAPPREQYSERDGEPRVAIDFPVRRR